MSDVILHGYFRSSATWRVRIALAIKGIAYHRKSYALLEGEQRSAAFLAMNPQGLVPALEIDGLVLTQSYAICEYLDETRPEPPLLGTTPAERAQVRAFALAIACDIHPLQNLRVLQAIKADLGSERSRRWAADVNREGLAACAGMIPDDGRLFCFGERPTLADVFLIPQMGNARRYGVDIEWLQLARIEAHCLGLPPFGDSAPDRQPEAG